MLPRFIIPLLLLAPLAGAEDESSAFREHVQVELVAGHESVQPGAATFVGLLFKLDLAWHIYWKNPGDSGEPPSVKWTVPDGVIVGDFLWPAPKRIEADGMVTFGYEGEVLLSAPLAIASDFEGDTVEIKAAATWLVCADVCLGQEAELVLSIPVSAGEMQKSAAADAPSLAQIPRPANADGVAVIHKGGIVEVTLDPEVFRPGPKYLFFPDEDIVELAKLTEQNVPKFTAPRSPTRTEPIERVTGVMVRTNADGRQAYWFDVGVHDREAIMKNPVQERWEDYWWLALLLGGATVLGFLYAAKSRKRTRSTP